MKKIFLFILVGCLFSNCKKKSKSFDDYIEVDKLSTVKSLNPNSNFSAKINSEGAIFGNLDYLSQNTRFYSNDNFGSTKQQSEYIENNTKNSLGNILYDDGNNSFLTLDGNQRLPMSAIYQSTDHGFSYSKYMMLYSVNFLSGTYPCFLNKDLAFYINTERCATCTNYSLVVHKIVNGQDITISTTSMNNSIPATVCCDFLNENIGWVIIQYGTYAYNILKTIDGGLTWSVPIPISSTLFSLTNGNSNSKIKVLNDHSLILVSGDKKSCYISHDSGLSWTFINTSIFADFQFCNESIGYAITYEKGYNYRGYLYKTTDSGSSWNRVSNKLIYTYKLYFLNENIGLITAPGIVQKTSDGGNTFELLTYPNLP
jgi:photosystem II stability/assembly factor-like uncharacterized protein